MKRRAELPGAIAVAGVAPRPPALSGTRPPARVAPASADAFALARRDPAFAAAMAAEAPRLPVMQQLGVPAFGLAWVVGAWWSIAHLPGASLAITIPVAILLLGMLVALTTRRRRRLFAPLERRLGSVVRRHHELIGGGDDTTPIPEQRALLVLEDGTHRHVAGDDAVMRPIAEGDLGIAVIQYDRLVAFHRVG